MDDTTTTAPKHNRLAKRTLGSVFGRVSWAWVSIVAAVMGVFGAVFLVSAAVVHLLNVDGGAAVPLVAAVMVSTALFQKVRGWVMRRWLVPADETQTAPLDDPNDEDRVPTVSLRTDALELHGLSQIGTYRFLSVLGKGGMGRVYLASDSRSGRKVAVKVLSLEVADREAVVKRFQREIMALKMLNHPNIVQMIEAGFEQGIHYLAMEWIDGLSLRERLNREGRMGLTEAVLLLCDIAEAIDAAHAVGIVHRDVKPSNILLRRLPDRVQGVLSDFGIAKLVENHSGRLTDMNIVGSLDTIAPEQVLATREVDRRADFYSFGVVAYRLLTGHHPYEGVPRSSMLMAHVRQAPIDPRVFAPSLPVPVSQMLLKALDKRPDHRPATAREFVLPLKEEYL